MSAPRALVAFCLLAVPAYGQQKCPNPSSGFTYQLTPDPQLAIYDRFASQFTLIFRSGATHTFINVPLAVAQAGSISRNGPMVFASVFGVYPQLVLGTQWSCSISTMSGGLLESTQ